MQNQNDYSQGFNTPPQSGSVVAPIPPNPTPAPTLSVSAETTPARNTSLVKTIVIIAVSLIAATFIVLFVWMYLQWNEAQTAVNSKIDEAVAIAVDENTTKLENDFADREKQPYKTFGGPTDYGSLSFEYPKTWSVYEAADASAGGNFEAYLNPDKVSPIDDKTIFSLRVKIVADPIEEISENYQDGVEDGELTPSTQPIGKDGDIATVYTGQITDEFQGKIAIFKIRDKTVILQTDAMIFEGEFNHVLETVRYNK